MSLLDFPTPEEIEQERLKSIDSYLMEQIYPRLASTQQINIQKYLHRGYNTTQAFSYAGISVGCIR